MDYMQVNRFSQLVQLLDKHNTYFLLLLLLCVFQIGKGKYKKIHVHKVLKVIDLNLNKHRSQGNRINNQVFSYNSCSSSVKTHMIV